MFEKDAPNAGVEASEQTDLLVVRPVCFLTGLVAVVNYLLWRKVGTAAATSQCRVWRLAGQAGWHRVEKGRECIYVR